MRYIKLGYNNRKKHPMSTPVGPYTPFMKTDNLVFISGQIGIVDGQVVAGGIEAELVQALENLNTVLENAGASKADVVKTTVFLTDMDHYGQMNEIYMNFFDSHRPARSAVAVAALPLGAVIEIEAIAKLS